VKLEEPIAMCATQQLSYWVRGHVPKGKFRGALLSKCGGLEGEEDAYDIIHGKVQHGWLIACAGDLSGCGWDTTLYFLTEPLPEGTTTFHDEFDGFPESGPIVDGPHEVTWWEAASA
jgi:hypothetical protein